MYGMCEDAPCCGCCGMVGGVMYSSEYPLHEPEYDDSE